jgi:flagellar biosynthesis protein FliQ
VTVDEAVWLGQEAMFTALLIATPPMLAALVVGTLVSMLQTVTQLQEVTLAFVPKVAAVFLVLAAMSGWMLQTAVTYGTVAFSRIGDTP